MHTGFCLHFSYNYRGKKEWLEQNKCATCENFSENTSSWLVTEAYILLWYILLRVTMQAFSYLKDLPVETKTTIGLYASSNTAITAQFIITRDVYTPIVSVQKYYFKGSFNNKVWKCVLRICYFLKAHCIPTKKPQHMGKACKIFRNKISSLVF